MRKVHIGEEVWKYKVGKKFITIKRSKNWSHLVVKSAVGKVRKVWSWREMDYVNKLEVKPSHIKDYIEKHLLWTVKRPRKS